MSNYEVILFDLDGTLTDPKEGITKSVQYALGKLDIVVDNLDNLTPFIGPPLQVTFKELYQFNEQQIADALMFYRQRFQEKGMYENKVYEGVPEMLKQLKTAGYQLAIATSKPTVFAEQILNHFELHHYFDCIMGSELDGTRTSKGAVIEEIIHQLKLDNVKQCVMIGDRLHDIIGANENNMPSIGVTFGYGSRQELEMAGATHIIDSVLEFKNLFSRVPIT
ncbi:phosphoglycolate phosphatase [Solibacillus sp. R5-41]|uniref:HAD family hydrolase n=1 Tax=Solibacillus sp. R5-41 TaxID=2048654 RepID=UPI000C1269EB|nr:HAD family hydrolase [Solibacillus sp. R5-41]ATP41614.1 phosphoglycolate phosphatase [Solibacillus sp. R5-41]